MKKRLINRYSILTKDGDLFAWGTCPMWFAEIDRGRFARSESRFVVEKVAWVGAVPVCTLHNH